jgi:hypothetical protein
MTKPTISWAKLNRIFSCVVSVTWLSPLEELLAEAAQDDPKWAVYAEAVAEHRAFLKTMCADNRELLLSQLTSSMRKRAQGMTDDELHAELRAGTL